VEQTDQTAEQVFDSITGFDEIAIAQHFGRTVQELAEKDASMFARALVFVVKRRDGATDDEARNLALGQTMKEYNAFFAEPSEEEAGKDEEPEPLPEASLSSVS
jgi:hypothetical protein